MNGRSLTWIVLSVALVLGAAHGLLRASNEPEVREVVDWEPYASLGDPPYDGKVLLEFSASWCAPCRRMQVTTFRDPVLGEHVGALGLRTVRLEWTPESEVRFSKTMGRYGVSGLPASVVIDRDGRVSGPISGALDAASYVDAIRERIATLDRALYWHSPERLDELDGLKLLGFESFWSIDYRLRLDWRVAPSEALSRWIREHLVLVGDDFDRHPQASDHYRRFRIRSVPTLILLGPDRRELARFEGSREIDGAPDAIARIAREHGFPIPDPPDDRTRVRPERP